MESEKILKPYKPQILKVNQIEKDKYKKENGMNTFPQIFLIDNNKKIKIGGYTDTIELLDKIFKNESINYSNNDAEKLKKFFLNK
jgi:glutaredoxin